MTALLVAPPPEVVPMNKRWLLQSAEGVACHGITVEVWHKLVVRIAKNLYFLEIYGELGDRYKHPWAELLLDQAIGFLRAYAANPTRSYAPSHPVDIAWHDFMLYSEFYVPFCDWLAGRYIHHVTDDMVPVPAGSRLVEKTMISMREQGLTVVEMAWPPRASCHLEGEGGCHLQPPPPAN